MISKETLASVHSGIITDDELNEAIEHYSSLASNLKCHGELYQ